MDRYLHRSFHALGDLTRLAVIARLLDWPASVSTIAEPPSVALPAFTKYLGVLLRAGLIGSSKSGHVRTCFIEPAAFWAIDHRFRERRARWESLLERLAARLDRTKEDGPPETFHETLVVARDFNTTPERLFQARADPKVREK